jgi:hypothetical protein
MISERTLGVAVDQGIISAEQAERLAELERRQHPGEVVDEEKLRFITGFGDIFVTIGLVLFLGALAYFANDVAGGPAMWAIVAAAGWVLAEIFTRRHRMALPSIALLLIFAGAVFAFALLVGERTIAPGPATSAAVWPSLYQEQPWVFIGAALVALVAAVLHYGRFGVPITIAVVVAALIGVIVGFLALLAPRFLTDNAQVITLVFGILVFALAMRFDMSDRLRVTRRTDIAFWLHLLAAPLIVHPLIGGFIMRGEFDRGTAKAVLATFLGLAVIAVLVDRRAILVSGLAYAGASFGSLLRQTTLASDTLPASIFVLGAFVLVVSAGWQPLRRTFLALLPEGLARLLPKARTSR